MRLACGPFRHAACESNPRAVSTSRRTRPASRWPAPIKVRRCAQGYEARPGGHRARLILGSRSGVNRCAIQHNRVFCKVQPVANQVGLVSAPLRASPSAPFGFAEVRLCLAPLRVCRAASAARRAPKPKCVRSRLRRHRRGSSQRGLRRVRGVEAPARPGQSAGAGSCRLRRHSLPAPSACPSRPPPRSGDSPKAKRGLSCGASRGLALHRTGERASVRAVSKVRAAPRAHARP